MDSNPISLLGPGECVSTIRGGQEGNRGFQEWYFPFIFVALPWSATKLAR